MLGLVQTRDEALAEAAEGKALAEQSALDGLLEGVVDGVLGWVTGSSDARTAYSITAIGLTTARDVAVRTAFAAFDVAAIERGAEAERLGATANRNRIISDVQAYRDEVANSPASNSTPPLDPSIMQPGLLPSEMAQLHAENRARDRSNTLAEWGVTALRTWIASVDASGVLNASTTTTTTTTANGANGPDSTGLGAAGPGTNGSGTNGAGNDWRTQLQNALSRLQALTGDDSTGTTNGSEPGGDGSGGDGANSPTTNGDGSGLNTGGDGGNPAGADKFVPVLVHFFLVFAVDKQREAFGEFEVRAAVVTHEGLTPDDELGGRDGAILARTSDVLDLRVREGRGVERDCRFQLVVEHQERCHFGHLRVSFDGASAG